MAKEKAPKKKKKAKSSRSGGGAQQFLIWHGEKIVAGVVVLVALLFALQGLGYLGPAISWQPDELERIAGEAETAIKASERNANEEGVEFFDHAAYAVQIRNPIRAAPYRTEKQWHPILDPTQRLPSASQ